MNLKSFSYGSQFVDKKDIKEVSNSLKNSFLTNGPYVKKFENACEQKIKSNYAFSCNSGTSSLALAFLAANVKKNDVIIMPVINFIAAANVAKVLNAKVYFADIDYNTGQMTPKNVIDCIKSNKIKKIKIILTMYLGGYPRNIYEFYKLKKKFKCILIEDACHAFGAEYTFKNKNYKIGSCKHSDISTFSFHPLKTITTGEGGLITTNSKIFAKKIKLLRSHGIYKSKNYWKYNVLLNGYNFRLSDINAALGYSQLKKIDKFIKKRKKIFQLYKSNFKNFKFLRIIDESFNSKASYHLMILLIDFSKLKIDKSRLIKMLIKYKIYCQFHYIPIYKFSKFNAKNLSIYPNSKKYFNNALSIPIYYNLKFSEVKYITNIIKKILFLNLKTKSKLRL